MSIESLPNNFRDPALDPFSPFSIAWTHIMIHHSGAWEKSAEQIRQYHKKLGWRDIGYHYVVEYPSGKVVKGRSIILPGAHCNKNRMNYLAIGVCFIGNYLEQELSDQMFHSGLVLLTNLVKEHKILIENIIGHKSQAATKCPGRIDVDAFKRVLSRSMI